MDKDKLHKKTLKWATKNLKENKKSYKNAKESANPYIKEWEQEVLISELILKAVEFYIQNGGNDGTN